MVLAAMVILVVFFVPVDKLFEEVELGGATFNSPRRCFRSIREAGLSKSSIEPRSIVQHNHVHIDAWFCGLL